MCFFCQKHISTRNVTKEEKHSAHTERDHFSLYCVIELIARLHLHHMGFCHFISKGSQGVMAQRKWQHHAFV